MLARSLSLCLLNSSMRTRLTSAPVTRLLTKIYAFIAMPTSGFLTYRMNSAPRLRMVSLTRREGQGTERMTSGGAADNHWDEDSEQAEYDWRQVPLVPDLSYGKERRISFSTSSHSDFRHPNRTIRFLATKDSKEILCFPKVGFSDCIHSDSPCLFAVSYPILIPCLSVILSRSFASVYYPLEFSGKL